MQGPAALMRRTGAPCSKRSKDNNTTVTHQLCIDVEVKLQGIEHGAEGWGMG